MVEIDVVALSYDGDEGGTLKMMEVAAHSYDGGGSTLILWRWRWWIAHMMKKEVPAQFYMEDGGRGTCEMEMKVQVISMEAAHS